MRKSSSIVLFFFFFCSIINPVFALNKCGDIWPPESIPGTSCGDGVIDLLDYYEAIDIFLGFVVPTPCQLQNGDIPNGKPPNCSNCEANGIIDLNDALVIADKVADVDNCCDYCSDGDLDEDYILADGDGNGIPGDNPCTGGERKNCDDNCPETSNTDQLDTYPPGGNGIGDACECEGDYDCDGDVDGNDIFTFKANFGRNPSYYFNPCTGLHPCPGDFDCDQDVDGTDATVFKADFGRSLLGNSCPTCKVGDYCYVKTCINNADCDIEYYCEKLVGQCDTQGACSVIPSGCPSIFIPICGCDGINYGNDCEIKWEGESIDHYEWCTE